jgi:hypothetical protein
MAPRPADESNGGRDAALSALRPYTDSRAACIMALVYATLYVIPV